MKIESILAELGIKEYRSNDGRVGWPEVVSYEAVDGSAHFMCPPRDGTPFKEVIHNHAGYQYLKQHGLLHSDKHMGPRGKLTDNRNAKL